MSVRRSVSLSQRAVDWAREKAVRERRSFSSVVDEALRDAERDERRERTLLALEDERNRLLER